MPMSAATLSQYTGVSVQFVEQILKPLKQSGLTNSVRGAAGGHRLARPAEEITLGAVVRLMEGGIRLSVCCGDKANDCPRRDGCLTRRAWLQVSESLERELDAITLANLLHSGDVCGTGQACLDHKQSGKARKPARADVKNPRVAARKAKAAR